MLWLGVYSVALNAAERRVDAGTAAMLINAGPILIAVLAGVFLQEGFPPRLFAGCAVAFGGCVLIAAAHAHGGDGLGIVLLVIAAVAYAFAVIVQKGVLARVDGFTVTWLGCAAATIATLPFAPTLIHEAGDAAAIGWLVYLGVVPTALGFATWNYALRRTSAGQMASLTYLIPVLAVLLGWAVLGETPPAIAVVGGAICLAGVYLAAVVEMVGPAQVSRTPGRMAPPSNGPGPVESSAYQSRTQRELLSPSAYLLPIVRELPLLPHPPPRARLTTPA